MRRPQSRNFETPQGFLGATAVYFGWGPLGVLVWLLLTEHHVWGLVRVLVATLILGGWVWLMFVRPIQSRRSASAGYDAAVPKGWAAMLIGKWPRYAEEIGWCVPGVNGRSPQMIARLTGVRPHQLGVAFRVLPMAGRQAASQIIADTPLVESMLGVPVQVVDRGPAWVDLVAVFVDPLASPRPARDHNPGLPDGWAK